MHKECFKCHRLLPISEFYRHSMMADGHLNKCKECTRCDVIQNRRLRVDYYMEYDNKRSALPHRVAKRKQILACQAEENPEKMKARYAAGNALRDGHIRREPCYFCGGKENLEMHHPDYSQPLRVYWLCRTCHRKLDNMTKGGRLAGQAHTTTPEESK